MVDISCKDHSELSHIELDGTDECKAEENNCRICFESGSYNNELIYPCKCSGTIKYVHEECLKVWILSKNSDFKDAACDLCKTPFAMDVVFVTRWSCSNCRENFLKLMMYLIIITLIVSITAIIVNYLVQGLQDSELKPEEKVYFSLVIFVCLAILISLLVGFVKSLISSMKETKLQNWHIKSLVRNEITETSNNVDTHNQDEVIRARGAIPEVMIVPSQSRYNGVRVMPIVTPLSLTMVNRDPNGVSYFSRSNTSREASNRFRNVNNEMPK